MILGEWLSVSWVNDCGSPRPADVRETGRGSRPRGASAPVEGGLRRRHRAGEAGPAGRGVSSGVTDWRHFRKTVCPGARAAPPSAHDYDPGRSVADVHRSIGAGPAAVQPIAETCSPALVTAALVAGLLAGYGIALPVGAVAAYLVALTARTSLRIGVFGALGVATADGLYALIAVVGGSALTPSSSRSRFHSAGPPPPCSSRWPCRVVPPPSTGTAAGRRRSVSTNRLPPLFGPMRCCWRSR